MSCEIGEICDSNDREELIEWRLQSDQLVNIEGIYLPIYNDSLGNYYQDKSDIVRVNSTEVNVRNLALEISSGKTICLNGQHTVSCGKTTLAEYMAKRVERLSPKVEDYCAYVKAHENPFEKSQQKKES